MSVPTAGTPRFRPAYHFTPRAHWMNDPNGLVFHDGIYHLFFQYHPHGDVWGPMHWGHATSRDLLCWHEQPPALAPDALGMVFSGSAVVDVGNSADLGPPGSLPLVAMFTCHDSAAAAAGRLGHQSQGLASSLDGGLTWTRHAGNPVLVDAARRDFRDPKLRWLPDRGRWLASLACGDRIGFYSSTDLKAWRFESEFGAGLGAQGGVWECPDLFPLPGPDGRTRWVLLVSLMPGGPNGGSATQYFVGDFDGCRFVPEDAQLRWLDHGPDDYAGVTWSGVDDRALFIGWMSNWAYAAQVPTAPWRGAMTMPRELELQRPGARTLVVSRPARELAALVLGPPVFRCAAGALPLDLSAGLPGTQGRFRLQLATADLRGLQLTLHNAAGDRLALGYDAPSAQWWLDRRASGEAGFHPDFGARAVAPRLTHAAAADLDVWFDACSVELFADGGLTVLTSLVFPRAPWTHAVLEGAPGQGVEWLQLSALRDPRTGPA